MSMVIVGDSTKVLLRGPLFRLAIVDPPYLQTSLSWDRDFDWLNLLGDVMQRSSSFWVFGSFKSLLRVTSRASAAGWKLAQDVVWEKQNGSRPTWDRFRPVHELVLQFYRGPWAQIPTNKVVTRGAKPKSFLRTASPPHTGEFGASSYEVGDERWVRSVMRFRNLNRSGRHPTQKPAQLISNLIKHSSHKGDWVLDPCCGSGVSVVEAERLERIAVGVEKEPGYVLGAGI